VAALSDCFSFRLTKSAPKEEERADMLVVDLGSEEPIETALARDASTPPAGLAASVRAAALAYHRGAARRLYFALPYLPQTSSTTTFAAARGHISLTEMARIIASAMGVPYDDIYISAGRRFPVLAGAIEPEDSPWLRIPMPRVRVWAPDGRREYWKRLFESGYNAALVRVSYQ